MIALIIKNEAGEIACLYPTMREALEDKADHEANGYEAKIISYER